MEGHTVKILTQSHSHFSWQTLKITFTIYKTNQQPTINNKKPHNNKKTQSKSNEPNKKKTKTNQKPPNKKKKPKQETTEWQNMIVG